MSAQQRTPQPPPPPPPSQPSAQLTESQANIYVQQRRGVGNIETLAANARPNAAVRDISPSTGSPATVPKSPARTQLPLSASTTSPGGSQKTQFFAHNPNLRSE